MVRDVAGHDRRADALGLERGLLLVDGSDPGAFLVVEDRNADRTGQVVFGELGRAARIEHRAELAQLRERQRRGDRTFGALAMKRQLGHLAF